MNTAYEHDIKVCHDILKLGGTILYPTDTTWGIGCDATNPDAVDKIFKVKHRDASKSFVVLMTDIRQLSQYLAAPPPDLESKINGFTEPTTIIYPNAIQLADQLLAEDGSVAVRITQDPFCRSLIKRFRKPLVSSSANLSGHPPPLHFALIDKAITREVDYVVQWRQDDISTRQPSAILKLMPDGSFMKIR
jgi:L-threonylcarbamoyladenylate synthase